MSQLKYEKKQLADQMSVDGKNIYGKLITGPTMSLDEVADEIAHTTGMQPRACANVLRALPEVIHHFVRGGLGVNIGFATLKPAIRTTATTADGAVEVKSRRLTCRLTTEMKQLMESIRVTVKSDGTVEDDDDSSDSSSSPNGEAGEGSSSDDSSSGGGGGGFGGNE